MTLRTVTTDIGLHYFFRTLDYDDDDDNATMKLLSLACLSDRHEYCSLVLLVLLVINVTATQEIDDRGVQDVNVVLA